MPGMPMKMPAMKSTQCITKEQAADPNASVPQNPHDKNNTCKVTDYKVAGNKVSWTMKCGAPNPMSGTGEITYATDSYDGWMKMTTERRRDDDEVQGEAAGRLRQVAGETALRPPL